MMTIGEFAHASGLTVKAVRFYDARGVLTPATTDDLTGYRYYAAEQLRRGIALGVLRRADVALPDAHRIVDEPDRAAALLERVVADVTAARERQDAALRDARTALDLLATAVAVHERDAPAQDWVGLRWALAGAPGADDELPDRMGREIEQLAGAVARLPGAPGPASPFWTVFRSDGTATGVEIELACAVTRPVDPAALAFTGTGTPCAGRRPAGPELYTVAAADDVERMAALALPPPAVLALEEELERRLPSDRRSEVRQVARYGDGGGDGGGDAPTGFEYVAALG